jgi:hypothetical protein
MSAVTRMSRAPREARELSRCCAAETPAGEPVRVRGRLRGGAARLGGDDIRRAELGPHVVQQNAQRHAVQHAPAHDLRHSASSRTLRGRVAAPRTSLGRPVAQSLQKIDASWSAPRPWSEPPRRNRLLGPRTQLKRGDGGFRERLRDVVVDPLAQQPAQHRAAGQGQRSDCHRAEPLCHGRGQRTHPAGESLRMPSSELSLSSSGFSRTLPHASRYI